MGLSGQGPFCSTLPLTGDRLVTTRAEGHLLLGVRCNNLTGSSGKRPSARVERSDGVRSTVHSTH